jgi:hypothetical protein
VRCPRRQGSRGANSAGQPKSRYHRTSLRSWCYPPVIRPPIRPSRLPSILPTHSEHILHIVATSSFVEVLKTNTVPFRTISRMERVLAGGYLSAEINCQRHAMNSFWPPTKHVSTIAIRPYIASPEQMTVFPLCHAPKANQMRFCEMFHHGATRQPSLNSSVSTGSS